MLMYKNRFSYLFVFTCISHLCFLFAHETCNVFPGSAGRREEETDDEAQYYNEHIAPIIDRMTVQAKGNSEFFHSN